MALEKTPVLIQFTFQQKEFCERVAQSKDISFSRLVRVALAEYCGYDLSAEDAMNKASNKAGRPRIYATSADREQAARERASQKESLTRKLLEDHQKQQRRKDAAQMEKSLLSRGISLGK